MRILVLAFPRSGTKFAAQYFQNMGLDVGHEEIRKDGAVGYMFHDLHEQEESFDMVIHLIRDPRCCIPSAKANLPTPYTLRELEVWWLGWNLLFEASLEGWKARGAKTYRVRIEEWAAEMARLGFEAGEVPPLNFNHRKNYRPRTLDELRGPTQKLVKKYGYLYP